MDARTGVMHRPPPCDVQTPACLGQARLEETTCRPENFPAAHARRAAPRKVAERRGTPALHRNYYRFGVRHQPTFNIVAAHSKFKRDGRHLEKAWRATAASTKNHIGSNN